jgi:hypothetical protein
VTEIERLHIDFIKVEKIEPETTDEVPAASAQGCST